jgi:hypothetical protein
MTGIKHGPPGCSILVCPKQIKQTITVVRKISGRKESFQKKKCIARK